MPNVMIEGVIGWDVTPRGVRDQLKEVKAGEDITVEIASPGGSVYAGFQIYNLLKNWKGEVTVRLSGLAASMASYIALAGDKVVAEANVVYMIHNASVCACGDYNVMNEVAGRLERLSNLIAQVYVDKTGKTLAEIKELMDAETFYYGQEAVEAGFVDEIDGEEDAEARGRLLETAQGEIDACFELMKSEKEDEEDIKQVAALLDEGPSASVVDDSVAGAANNHQQEDKYMSLEKLLAENPGAKAEYDAAIVAARDAGVEVGKKEVREVIAKVAPYLGDSGYPQAVGELAVKVLKDEEAVSTLTATITVIDSMGAKARTDDAVADSVETGDIKVDQPAPKGKDGEITTADDFKASLEADKKRMSEV